MGAGWPQDDNNSFVLFILPPSCSHPALIL